MSAVLDDLCAKRDEAQKAFEAFVAPLVEQGQLTPEQKDQKTELRGKVDALDERIDEVAAEEKRKANLDEVRKGLNKTVATSEGVTYEPTTYGPGSSHSYALDLAKASSPAFRGHKEAMQRLIHAEHEFAVELANAKPEERHRMEKLVLQESRDGHDPEAAKSALAEFRRLGSVSRQELRAMDTTAGSGGSFATPVYFVQLYAPWVEFGRAFINQCTINPLPEYGMTVFMPALSGGAGVASQSTQNTAIQETDPTAGYLSNNLTTEAGQVTLSQQIIDRAGPNFAFDQMVFDQLRRDYNAKVDLYALNQTLGTSGVGSVPYTGSFALTAASGASSFRTKVAAAKVNTISTVGTVTTATHLYLQQARWEFIDAYTDTTGRPLVPGTQAGQFNAGVYAGTGDPTVEGDTGFKMAGLGVFSDGSIPNSGTTTQDQAIVARMSEIYVWEGTPVTRTVPQTLANNLSVLLQLYNYITLIVRYPKAVQVITGTAMTPPSF